MNLSLNLPNSAVNLILEKGQEAFVLAEYAKAWGKEAAVQQALSKCYTVAELAGPKGRLKRSSKTILNLIHLGKLRHETSGESKGYLVSEKAVREFLGDLPPEA